MTNNKGITLIALVITIIVLLILAGVSIAMLTGQNGILTQANSSKTATTKAEAVEKINLALNAVKAKIYEQQVTTSTYSPLDSNNKVKTEISAVMTSDLPDLTENTSAVDGKYTYSVDTTTGVLTIRYINTAQGIKTAVSGSITLKANGSTEAYTITEAK